MTFFYDMNKRLKEVLEAPKSVHQNLNERANSKAVEEGMFDSLKQGMAKAAKKGLEKLGHGSDEAMRKDLQRKMGVPQTGKKPMGEEYGPLESAGGTPTTPKQKKFAKLAPPANKITFADKIAGAKKEVDEVLGDVAANAMRKAVGSKKVADEGSDWSQLGKEYNRPKIGSIDRGHKHDIEHTATGRRVTRRTDDQGMSVGADDEKGASPEKRGRGRPKGSGKSIGAKGPNGKSKLMNNQEEMEEGNFWGQDKMAAQSEKKRDYPRTTTRVDQDGRGGTKTTTTKSPAPGKKKDEKELDEKAVSKKQQKFMGMVHAAQKGEKPASKEVAKVAKTMKKSDAEDFASTKHKGLPEKVKSKKSEGKKKEKTEEAGGTSTPTASSGFSYGKGIYDSLNREIENLIAESMSINASDSTEGGKSLTITATDDDAMRLAEIVRNAGLGGEGGEHEHPGAIEVHGSMDADGAEELAHDLRDEAGKHSPISGDEGECETCGSHDCGCGDIEEALDENQPDWPTDTETSDDAMQYSGGLNGPKSTGQATTPVIAAQDDRLGVDSDELRRLREMAGLISEQEQVMAPEEIEEAKEMCEVCEATPCKCDESVEESIAALRGLAGIQEAAKPDFTDVDDDGNETESWKKAEQDKKNAEDKKVDESIFRMTNLWKSYKG